MHATIRGLLLATIGFMTVLILTGAGAVFFLAEKQQAHFAPVPAYIDLSNDIFDALQTARLERGITNGLLISPASLTIDQEKQLSAVRRQTENALEVVLQSLSGSSFGPSDLDVEEIKQGVDALRNIRLRVDSAAQLSFQDRPTSLRDEWYSAVEKFTNPLNHALDRIDQQIEHGSSVEARMIGIRDIAWKIRVDAGDEIRLLNEEIVNRRKMTDERRRLFSVMRGRQDGLWALLKESATRVADNGGLQAAISNADRLYFGDYHAHRLALIRTFAAGEAANISLDEFRNSSRPERESLLAVATAAMEVAKREAAKELKEANWMASRARTLAIAAAISSVFAAWFLLVRIVNPITVFSQTMAAVADGTYVDSIPFQYRRDEIGALARSLRLFRDNAVEKQKAEVARLSAEASNKAKSQFLANMSHEIRTPMNGVMGAMELLKHSELTDRQEKLVSTAQNSAESLLGIINDILDISKIEAGKLSLDNVAFDLYDAICSSADLLVERAEAKGVELAVMVDPQLPVHVSGDAIRLKQILINLIGNAVKFTDHGSILVIAYQIGKTDTTASFRIDVCDSGIGMDTDAVSRIFKPFAQADSSTTRKFGGTGLGLAIVKQLVELKGGQVGVESTPGQGSTFWFTATLKTDASASSSKSVSYSFPEGLKALVAGNAIETREVICTYLSYNNIEVTQATTVPEAVAMIQANAKDGLSFDFVIVDTVLGDDQIAELASEMTAVSTCEQTKRILLASIGLSPERYDTAIRAGYSGFINRLVRPDELIETIAKLLKDGSTIRARDSRTTETSRDRDEHLHNSRILLTEDNLVNADIASRILIALGCQVTTASNGRIAVSTFEQNEFDAVLMDCQMPEMDGFEATRNIRRIERERGMAKTPIIALTANVFENDKRDCLAAGMDDFVSKPFKVVDLYAVLKRALVRSEKSSTNRAVA